MENGNSMASMIFIYVLIFVAAYFLFIRPERKRKKQQQQMRDSLKVGDVITTIGGIIGTIVELTDDAIVIETSEDRVRMQFARWAIGSVGQAKTETN